VFQKLCFLQPPVCSLLFSVILKLIAVKTLGVVVRSVLNYGPDKASALGATISTAFIGGGTRINEAY